MLKESWIIQLASPVIVFHSFSLARSDMLCIGSCKLQYDIYASFIMDAGRLISVLGFADKIYRQIREEEIVVADVIC